MNFPLDLSKLNQFQQEAVDFLAKRVTNAGWVTVTYCDQDRNTKAVFNIDQVENYFKSSEFRSDINSIASKYGLVQRNPEELVSLPIWTNLSQKMTQFNARSRINCLQSVVDQIRDFFRETLPALIWARIYQRLELDRIWIGLGILLLLLLIFFIIARTTRK